jgi:hypothetical protein
MSWMMLMQALEGLTGLYLAFDDWVTWHTSKIGSMRCLDTLCLEPDEDEVLNPELLFKFGPRIR